MGKPDDELRADIFGLVVDLRRGKHANESASDVTDRVLAAFAKWNRRTAPPAYPPEHATIEEFHAAPPAVPGEPLRTDRPPYICLGCDILYDACPDFDAYNCPACGEKVMPLHLFVSQGRKLHSSSGPLPRTPADPTGAEPGTGKP